MSTTPALSSLAEPENDDGRRNFLEKVEIGIGWVLDEMLPLRPVDRTALFREHK